MATGLFNLKQVNQAISQGAWSGYIAPRWVEYLVVAGGGGCGVVGGGGAGGLLTGIVSVATGSSYSVTIGGGGGAGAIGTNTSFGSITTIGGGTAAVSSGFGGSGGGAGHSGTIVPGQSVAGQGNRGGNNPTGGVTGAGGGGGAGTAGLDSSSAGGGNGGAGIGSNITGTLKVYAGGGGGSGNTSDGRGGVGGGGNAQANATDGGNSGAANTGGGAGGTYNVSGGAGGSGIVVVRYPGNVQFYTGGTVTYSNGYIVHNFTASGTLAPTTPTVVSEYQISRSLRFNSADSTYLNRTPASAGNRTTWTWSAWVKRSTLGTEQQLFSASNSSELAFGTGANIDKLFYIDSATSYRITTQVFRDVSAWYHIVFVWDTTQATAENRIKLYVNGTEVTSFSTFSNPTQNQTSSINNNSLHYLGEYYGGGAYYYNGYMTEVNFIDGQALPPTSFGYVNPATGIWSPAKYVGGYGTNGFYLNFSDNSNTTAATLGKDYSGNGNNWTPNNFSVTAGVGNDSLVDSPTSYGTDTGVGGTVRGNYATLNPLTTTAGTYTQGNLRYTGASAFRRSNSTVSVATGKWYWEVTLGNAPFSGRDATSANNAFGFGLSTVFNSTTDPSLLTDAIILADNAYYKNFSGAWTDSGVAFSSGDVLSIAVDLDGNTFTLRRNNTSLVTGTIGGTAGRELVPIILSYAGTYGVMDCNFGQRPFAYTAPSGFKALCTQNLPTPTIGATTATQAGKFFAPMTFTSFDGGGNIRGVGFQPDFSWTKGRSAAEANILSDVIRGNNAYLLTNSTAAEGTLTNVWVPNSDGYTIVPGTLSAGQTYMSWNWKANGAGSSNTAGSITSTVSANTTSGFSVVTYTGNGTAGATIGHGLGVAPSMIIVKARGASTEWAVYSQTLGINYVLQLSTTSAAISVTNKWSGTNSSVFGVNAASDVNGGSVTYVAYCFAPVSGYSAFGSFTGNGSADGPFVFTGFRPAYLLVKRSDSTYDWWIFDNKRLGYNATSYRLAPDLADAEYTTGPILDLTSNGFKIRDSSQGWNGSGGTIIFAAFAESPFKYSLAR